MELPRQLNIICVDMGIPTFDCAVHINSCMRGGKNPDHHASPSMLGLGIGGRVEHWGRPAIVSSTRTSKVDSHLGGYHDLVSMYIKGNTSHYSKLLTKMMDLLHLDGN